MTVFAPTISSLWQQIEDYGLDPEPFFLAQGIDPGIRFDPMERVPYKPLDRVVADVLKTVKDPHFGLKEAAYFLPTQMGPLGFAWLASHSLHDALTRLQRYSHVLADNLVIDLREEGDATVVTVIDPVSSMDAYQRDCSSLAVLVKMCRFICGEQWSPDRISLAHPQPADVSPHFTYFRCPVDFAATGNTLHIETRLARERVSGGNEHLAQMNDHIVVRYLAHRSQEDILNRTRAAILDSLGDGRVTEKEVANSLHLSPRQLNRKLKEEGANFRSLLLECRRELAEQYINDGTLTITEISFLLGFSESSSFSRAYKRWAGRSPTEARALASGA
jgi:AraC-like DNA-binding protein